MDGEPLAVRLARGAADGGLPHPDPRDLDVNRQPQAHRLPYLTRGGPGYATTTLGSSCTSRGSSAGGTAGPTVVIFLLSLVFTGSSPCGEGR